ncbi:MAG: hypothetical protein IJA29_10045 [Lachnospiraceae bacterium]|nr:hypothetical protein [Lachnospiraceae bacterium]
MKKQASLVFFITIICSIFLIGCANENSVDDNLNGQGNSQEIETNIVDEDEIIENNQVTEIKEDNVSNDTLMFSITAGNAFIIEEGEVGVEGYLIQGDVKEGDTVELVGLGKERVIATVNYVIEPSSKLVELHGEDFRMISLSGVNKDQVHQGMMMATPGTVEDYSTFKAEIYMYTQEELDELNGAEGVSIESGEELFVYVYELLELGTIELPTEISELKPGETAVITITLDVPRVVIEGTPINIASKKTWQVSGEGTIIELIE